LYLGLHDRRLIGSEAGLEAVTKREMYGFVEIRTRAVKPVFCSLS
jgi:hypothetical protein